MIECHSLILLHPSHDNDSTRAWLQSFNGQVAPSFILAAGFAMALVGARSSSDPAKQRARRKKSLIRIGQVYLVSLFLRQWSWKLTENPIRLLWTDVLGLIAYSLLLIWAILFLLPKGKSIAFSVCLSIFVLVCPFVWGDKDFGWFTPFLNTKWYGDTWPLFPWAGYAMLGALLGLNAGRSRGAHQSLMRGAVIVLLCGLALSAATSPIQRLYGNHSVYPLVDFATRSWKIAVSILALLGIEHLSASYKWMTKNPLIWICDVFGKQSLLAYAGHLLLLFGFSFWFLKLNLYSDYLQKCDWRQYWLLMPSLLALTLAVCFGWSKVSLLWKKKGTGQ